MYQNKQSTVILWFKILKILGAQIHVYPSAHLMCPLSAALTLIKWPVQLFSA